MKRDLFQQFEDGTLAHAGQRTDIGLCAWNAHKDFPGVFLKNVVSTAQTAGLCTCHLVRIDPGCKIGMHAHPSSLELHEVMQGSGVCVTEEGEIPYAPGTLSILPCNAPHEVRAGKEGLRLFAKFITVSA